MRFLCWTLLAASAALAATVVPASADEAKKFNGAWMVAMTTERGSCDKSYRYGIAIRDGSINHRGAEGPLSLSGEVDDGGKVRVVVMQGLARAGGTGRLQGDSGAGTWHLPSFGCSGRWIASRLSAS